ncbi:MAG: sodium:proton antiporter [Candidatus Bathyarchaeota archaeon]|nr:sodium:proton antiporter [Candidatus Bathyarchaeota archaeon]
MPLHGQLQAIYNILLVVTVINLATRRLRLPSSLALILAGVMSTVLTSFSLPILSPEIFMSLLLPPILFQETLHLDIDGFIDESKPVFGFAIFGTLLMIAAVSLFLNMVLGFSLLEAFLLGIIIAPTDPVAVINVFQDIGVVKRFQLIVCGESLFNDGIAIALYSIVASIITLGTITTTSVVKITAMAILGGVLLGILFSYAAHILFCWTDDKFTEVLISFLVAFGVFWISETIGASGVIATVTTGLIINYRTHAFGGIGKDSFEMLEAIWEFVGFAASSIAFIFIGANLNISVLFANVYPTIYLFAFIMISRHIMVYVVGNLIERLGSKKIPGNWMPGLSWSGLRGAVSVVLALGVSGLGLPHADDIMALTFGVVLASNVIQGLSISKVLTHLGLTPQSGDLPGEAKEVAPQRMNAEYSSQGFKTEGSIGEKILFSAPEYFVFETRIGTWILLRLQHALEFINMYAVTKMPKAEGGMLRRGFAFSTDLIVFGLTRITQARRDYYWEREKQYATDRSRQLDSLYEIRKRQVDRIMKSGGIDGLRRRKPKKPKPSDTE